MKDVLVKTSYGIVKGYVQQNGYYWISLFEVKPQYRGKGYGRKLLDFLPAKCELLAYPLRGSNRNLQQLINFYKLAGFILVKDKFDNPIMRKG